MQVMMNMRPFLLTHSLQLIKLPEKITLITPKAIPFDQD